MKYLRYLIFALSVGLFVGCDFLDCDESSDYTKEDLFASYNRAKQMVTNIYGYLPHDFCNVDGAMLDAATDDAVHVYQSSQIQRFTNGAWSSSYTVDDVWGHLYEGIRAANFYLKESEGQTFEEWKFADDYASIMKEFTNYQYEVRFMRALFYFELAKRYNRVPLVDKVLTLDEVNSLVPSTCDKVMQYVVDECDAITTETALPVNYNGFASKESGRITRGAALALKARTLLYMASPLFSPTQSTDKWKKAARAAYAIIGSADELGYGLDKFETLFGASNNTSKEVILARSIGETGDFEKSNFPMGVEQGKTSTCPTQNLMEAYENADGTPFDWEATIQAGKDPYAGRDPRMKLTIVVNNMAWPAKAPVEIWEGGANGRPLQNATKTGYYLRKYVNNEISFASGSKVTKKFHNWVLFRYAEVLLNYAEAMINAFDNPGYTDTEFPISALDAVNQVRARAGVDMGAIPSGISSADFVKRLRNERRVELAFEGHRFWDVRRWKALNDTKNIYAVEVKKSGDKFVYTKYLFATHNIDDCMYFYPISDKERYKNENLLQNPGW